MRNSNDETIRLRMASSIQTQEDEKTELIKEIYKDYNEIIDKLKEQFTTDNLLNEIISENKSKTKSFSISLPSLSSVFSSSKEINPLDKKIKDAERIIDLAFRDLYQLFEATSNPNDPTNKTTVLKTKIEERINERMKKINPRTSFNYKYISEYLGTTKEIPVSFGGKKNRKLKKY